MIWKNFELRNFEWGKTEDYLAIGQRFGLTFVGSFTVSNVQHGWKMAGDLKTSQLGQTQGGGEFGSFGRRGEQSQMRGKSLLRRGTGASQDFCGFASQEGRREKSEGDLVGV